MQAKVWRVMGLTTALGATLAMAEAESGTNAVPHRGERQRPSREEILNRYDTDGDGALSETERQAMHEDRDGRRGGPPPDMPPREELISQFDTDGDGKLNEAERSAMRASMEKQHEERRAEREARRQERMERFDADGDGTLNEDERQAMREAHRSERRPPPEPRGRPAAKGDRE